VHDIASMNLQYDFFDSLLTFTHGRKDFCLNLEQETIGSIVRSRKSHPLIRGVRRWIERRDRRWDSQDLRSRRAGSDVIQKSEDRKQTGTIRSVIAGPVATLQEHRNENRHLEFRPVPDIVGSGAYTTDADGSKIDVCVFIFLRVGFLEVSPQLKLNPGILERTIQVIVYKVVQTLSVGKQRQDTHSRVKKM